MERRRKVKEDLPGGIDNIMCSYLGFAVDKAIPDVWLQHSVLLLGIISMGWDEWVEI